MNDKSKVLAKIKIDNGENCFVMTFDSLEIYKATQEVIEDCLKNNNTRLKYLCGWEETLFPSSYLQNSVITYLSHENTFI
tara:strand:- start:281 stop:520 length:240 start_codon:yes stop_codon:yes gene_type:complete